MPFALRPWFSRLRTDTALDTVEDMDAWRSHLTLTVVVAVAAILPASLFFIAPVLWRQQHYVVLTVDLVITSWMLLTVLWRRGPFRPRPLAVAGISLAMTATYFYQLGPGLNRSAWAMGFVLLCAMFFGPRGATIAAGIIAAMLLALYQFIALDLPAWQAALAEPFGSQMMYIVSLPALSLVISLPVAYLMRGMDRALRRERTIRQQLASEHEALERAVMQLKNEQHERRRLEENLQRTRRLEALGRLAGGIAHDLNNMLVPIFARTEMLTARLGPDAPERHDLDSIRQAGERARDVIQQVLLFSREAPKPDDHVDLGPLLAEIIGQYLHAPPAKITVAADVKHHATVHANRTALHQVFLNLITNALAAMEGKGGVITIRVQVLPAGTPPADHQAQLARGCAYACVLVQDTGCGMNEETAARAFEPFFTTKPFGRGTGLGLATAHGIITAYKGVITLETTPGTGTSFRVYLPLSQAPLPLSGLGSPSSPLPGQLHGRVLLVDDDQAARAGIAAQLEALGLQVCQAVSGAQALQVLGEGTPIHVLLCDYQMPEMTGPEVVDAARIMLPDLPAAIVSGHADLNLYEEAARLGIRHILYKPFSGEALADALQALLGARALHTGPESPGQP